MSEPEALEQKAELLPDLDGHAEPYPGLLGLFLAFTLLDLVAPLCFEVSPWIALALFGAIAGQIAAIGLWSVLGPLTRVKRLVLPLLWLTWMASCLIVASAVREAVFPFDILRAFFFLPLLLFATQIPFWLMRFFFGWTVAHLATESPSRKAGIQFSIADLLIAITYLCVILGTTQVGMAVGGPQLELVGRQDTNALLLGAILLAGGWSIWVAFIAIPCTYLMLGPKQRITGLVWYWLITSLILFLMVTFVAAVFNGAALLVIGRCLAIARANRYRLVRPRRQARHGGVAAHNESRPTAL